MTITELSWRAYSGLRRVGRSIVLSHPVIERLVRAPLVAGEQYLPINSMLRQTAPNPLVVDGHTIHYRPDEDMSLVLPLYLHDSYESETEEAVRNLLRPGMTVVDLGAHVGYFTLLAARLVGRGGRVYAFEPSRATFLILRKNVSANGYEDRVITVAQAVAAKPGRGRLQEVEGSSVSAYLDMAASFSLRPSQPGRDDIATSAEGPAAADRGASGTGDITVTSLDDYFAARDWPSVDLIKMDVEGCEHAVFDGMRQLSRRNPRMSLIFEFHHSNLQRTETNPELLIARVRELGFCKFRALWRELSILDLPRDLNLLLNVARRANINLLCEK
jgi:FkbM family methyltransferase